VIGRNFLGPSRIDQLEAKNRPRQPQRLAATSQHGNAWLKTIAQVPRPSQQPTNGPSSASQADEIARGIQEILNAEGAIVAVLRLDDATPHTLEHSFNKAYTIITLGPIMKVNSTVKIYEVAKKRVGVGTWAFPAVPIKGITLNAGGIAFLVDNKIVGGLGVSGASDGVIDEECAIKGREAAEPLLR
jgi:uncharacterized protein GlcG (DUF336 family)